MTLSRRHFATLLGAGAAGAVVMPSLVDRTLYGRAIAQDYAPPRFLAVRTPHGVDRDNWIPREPGGAEPRATDVDLMELTFEGTNQILTPLMGFRDRITVLDGVDTQVAKEGTRADRRTFHGHNEQGCVLTGAQPPADRESANFDNHPSLDFYLHGRLAAPVLITASVDYSGTWKCMSYDAAGLPRMPNASPNGVFRSCFPADFMPPAPGEDTVTNERLVLEHNRRTLMRLRDRLAHAERERIDRHLLAIEGRIPTGGGGMTGVCTVSGGDTPGNDGNLGSFDDVNATTRAHARVIAQAFACGRSRSATLQILNDYPNWFTDLPEVRTPEIVARYGSDTFRFHENLVHDYWATSGAEHETLRVGFTAGLRWSASHFAIVLEELDAMPDPLDPRGGSVLDNTVVLWSNEFGHDGHDNQHTRHPFVIAGGGGRVLKLGRYLRLRDVTSDARVPHNLLLTSIAQALGLGDVDYFGDRDLASRANYQGPLVPLMV